MGKTGDEVGAALDDRTRLVGCCCVRTDFVLKALPDVLFAFDM
jgi:hypothetical protein